ncbi:hypothetical protein [Massilia sp. Bi118]|uniref:hypothetical protein n=1 Tax=Massilia sp. Bi118 TaxID=2822346 RepID=UPI001E3CED98|nr:hypothetical protein [Massilia sp. Bi118]
MSSIHDARIDLSVQGQDVTVGIEGRLRVRDHLGADEVGCPSYQVQPMAEEIKEFSWNLAVRWVGKTLVLSHVANARCVFSNIDMLNWLVMMAGLLCKLGANFHYELGDLRCKTKTC